MKGKQGFSEPIYICKPDVAMPSFFFFFGIEKNKVTFYPSFLILHFVRGGEQSADEKGGCSC